MITYEYQCEKCGRIEVQQSMNDAALKKCPKCGAKAKRVISGGSGFIMKSAGEEPKCCEKGAPCCGESGGCDKSSCGV